MDAVKRHLQSTWPVSMPPLHAGTQEEKMTGEEARSSTKHTEETNDKQEKHRHGPRPGRQLHTSPHTLTHHRSAVSPRVRGFGPPQKEGKHCQQSTTMDKNEKRHTATASSSVPRPTGYGHSPAANTQRTRS
ncbi:hypothetical protein TcCL_Unassigned00075 [Trypanosoma cruzi]|nr:hypothetical protein TcCL_Unassigned00075 [Trypanosoma cruzi]